MIERFAAFYVNVLEPALLLLALLAIGLVLYQVIMLIVDGKKKGELANVMFKMMVGAIKWILVSLGKATLYLLKELYKYTKLIFASITDFFSSRI